MTFLLNVIVESLRSSLVAWVTALLTLFFGVGCSSLTKVELKPGTFFEARDGGQTNDNRYTGSLGLVTSYENGHKLAFKTRYRAIDEGNGGGDVGFGIEWTIPIWER